MSVYLCDHSPLVPLFLIVTHPHTKHEHFSFSSLVLISLSLIWWELFSLISLLIELPLQTNLALGLLIESRKGFSWKMIQEHPFYTTLQACTVVSTVDWQYQVDNTYCIVNLKMYNIGHLERFLPQVQSRDLNIFLFYYDLYDLI